MAAPTDSFVSFILRLRLQAGRPVVELQDLRSGEIHRLDGAEALWRFLLSRLPGLR
ncbi:MAG: hypothetical protein IV093_22005 [Rubrivivax sp.]|nr:hypothetical protein [Rubrivivax sp.]